MKTTDGTVPVWDLPTRVGHWLMVLCLALAWLTGESEEWRLVHVYAGGTMLGVALFRLLWGLVGSRYARFGNFLRGPGAVLAYLKSLPSTKPQHFVGHNPAGGWAIVALLGLILLGGFSGWLNFQEVGGDWLEEAHEVAANLLLMLVAVHLAGVIVGSLAHHENLVRPMITGRKIGNADDAIGNFRAFAVIALLASAIAVAWLASR